MLSVGINENVFLSNVQLDDKNWLTVSFKQKTDKEYNAFEALASENEVVRDESGAMDIKIFDPKVPKDVDNKGNKRTEEQIVKLIVNDINRTKDVLLHILKGYLTKDQIKFDLYQGTGIDADNFTKRIQDQSVLTLVHKNTCLGFINMVKEFLNDETKLFRLLLLRTSKDKHFATFRTAYIEDNPWWEDMSIPKEASKVKFSKYELDSGLNDGTPTAKSSADKTDAADSAPVTAESVFGG